MRTSAAPAARRLVTEVRPRVDGGLVLLAVAALSAAVMTRHVVAVGASIALLCFVAGYARHGERSLLLSGQAPVMGVAIVVLGFTSAGLLDVDDAWTAWRPAVAVAAYPILGRALLRLVADHRRVREGDVTVEGALVGVAAAALVQLVANDWRAPLLSTPWEDAQSALPSVLVGLDVALLVVGGRGLTTAAGRRGPLAFVLAGIGCLTLAHLLQTAAAGGGLATIAAVGLIVFGLAALHPRASAEPELLAEEPRLFSAVHAGVVVVALIAAPAVLAIQAARSINVSPTIATGAVISGVVLASYLVSLLQERASTEHRATHDPLTGLPNRTLFADRLERALAHARRADRPVGVLFIDLDRFKDVNDTFGHGAGDLLLKGVAARLARCCREEDTVARLAGDEFAILLPHVADSGDAVVVAQRVLDALGDPITVAGERILVGGSVGIAVCPDDGRSTDELLASADAAMYRAKDHGGHGYELFNPELSTQAHARLKLEAALIHGMECNELVLHYQPIVELATGRTVGAEALVRWEHPEQGLLLPGHFVPVAERSDLVVRLGELVIVDACRELRRWEDLGLRDRSISVNVSSRHFSHGLSSTVAAALRMTGANPRNLVVELTESTAADNLEVVAATLDELRGLGVRSAIDDFGTGYCGLRYLGTLPVDSLKIDKSFVQGMTPSAAAIVGATIAMGHSLGLTLVAEGVETEEQRRFLQSQGCDKVQGYLLGRPMPATDMVDRLRLESRQATALPAPVDDVVDFAGRMA